MMPTRWGVVVRVRYAEDDHATRLPRAFLLAVHYMDGCRAVHAIFARVGPRPILLNRHMLDAPPNMQTFSPALRFLPRRFR